ncbi:MAG TPA: S9 family peptidase, partial [Candidatus Sulfotelmatobacter sp.]|nr:S9 family peptidase [Candidatus Sulfotelmatobacter sp.]
MRRFASLSVLLTAILLMGGSSGQLSAQSSGKKPFTFEDMMALKRVGGPMISPNSKWVMFSAMEVDLNANKKTTHLWVVSLAGGEAHELPTTAAGETGGRWSPDGKSYLFISAVEGSSQVWVNSFEPSNGMPGGSPKKITNISTEADGAIWSPDGRNIVFTSEVYPGCADDACNKSSAEARANSKIKAT